MLDYTDIFQKFGLDDKESKVYSAALRVGKATVEQLAKEAGILRTTTYHQINALMEKGLMSTFQVGKKNFYVAEAPTNLTRLIEKQETEVKENRSLITSLLPELMSVYSKHGKRPVVRFFPGKEGLNTMREEILQMEGRELLIVSRYEKFLKVFNEEERDAFSRKRDARGISTRVLYTHNPLDNKEVPYGPKKFAPKNVRILPPTDADLGFDIYFYDQSICLSSLDDELWGVMISGQAVSESVRVLFEVAWQASKPLF